MDGENEKTSRQRTLDGLAKRFGCDDVLAQACREGIEVWCAPDGEGCVAYFDTGDAWIGLGGPVCAEERRPEVVAVFAECAKEAGRRASFFGSRADAGFGERARTLAIGQAAQFDPGLWPSRLARHRSLREQLRRARAKGVTVRELGPDERAASSAAFKEIGTIAEEWAAHRPMPAMSFLVASTPPPARTGTRYFAAERAGTMVSAAWIMPIPGDQGWLIEHIVRRTTGVPNGTSELIIDAVMRAVPEAPLVSFGLAPLTGSLAVGLRGIRRLASPLYRFGSLRQFKERLRPVAWEPQWLVAPGGDRLVSLYDSLVAFANRRIARFAARTLLATASGILWFLSVTLAAWAAVLLGLIALGHAAAVGYRARALALWVLWDVALAYAMFVTALEPRLARIGLIALAAVVDGALATFHWSSLPPASGVATWGLGVLAAFSPWVATALLVVAALQERRRSPTAVRP